MLVTTKGRYAMRLMIRIAQQGPDGKVPLRKVAEEEDISLKYLEQVVRPLMAAGRPKSARATCCARPRAPRCPWRATRSRTT